MAPVEQMFGLKLRKSCTLTYRGVCDVAAPVPQSPSAQAPQDWMDLISYGGINEQKVMKQEKNRADRIRPKDYQIEKEKTM